jgi:hypothetical protein
LGRLPILIKNFLLFFITLYPHKFDMSFTTDMLLLKTDTELQFFINNPSFYQPEVVAAAQREMQRRQPHASQPYAASLSSAALTEQALTPADFDEAPRRQAWALPSAVVVLAVIAGLGFWSRQPATAESPTPNAAETKPAAKPLSLKLETAVSSPIPYYDTEGYVDKALALVPAAEKSNDQRVNQYRAISRRFWAAQNPSVHLIRLAQQGQPTPVFGAQVDVVLAQWQDLSRVLAYSYDFDPVMADHLDRMKIISQYQRNALIELSNDCGAHKRPHLDSESSLEEQAKIAHLLGPLTHKNGPITVHL